MTWTIVVADDDARLRALLCRLLELDGRFRIVGEVGDGRRAVEVVRELRPDLLLLDLAMPRMDGMEVLEELRDDVRPVIVVLTGFDEPKLRRQVIDSGAVACLRKGRDFPALADALAEVVARDT